MEQNAFQQPGPEVSGRVWSFAGCKFNELSRELKVNGVEIELEPKPIEVLVELLRHAGEVLTTHE
jgi:DNA-binding response OmpR family regulator